jgi:hypothetical protein
LKGYFLFCFLVIVCCFAGFGQSGTWVWVNGDSLFNNAGVWGSQGAASINYYPPSLDRAVQWTDKQGNFWIFGGGGSGDSWGSDLWKYNPLANTWTWVKGPGQPYQWGNYGTMGVPSITNNPGARQEGSASWTDTAGDLWLFGGWASDINGQTNVINDLWRYHIATNEWTWMGGADTVYSFGLYGSLFQASDSFVPPCRAGSVGTWTDVNNNLWLFGGNRIESYGDLWRYNIASGQWAWMGGTQELNTSHKYGNLGVEDSSNFPGSRLSFARVVDSNYLYLAGGTGPGMQYSDVWEFNLNTNYWTWIGGDSGNVSTGHYSHYCSTAYGDMPRGGTTVCAQLNSCTPFLFIWGGWDFDLNGYNDLWSFDLMARKWRWLSGYQNYNVTGNFGMEGLTSASNMPPGAYGACFWCDNNGNLWLWGGSVIPSAYTNAMWKYTPDYACFPPGTSLSNGLSFQLSSALICKGDSVIISFIGNSNLNIFPGNSVEWLDSLHAKLRPDTTTTYFTTGLNACGNYDTTNFTIKVDALSANVTTTKNLVCLGDSATLCVSSNPSNLYTWSTGETTSCISTDQTGNYMVKVSDNNGCIAMSDTIGINVADTSLNVTLSPTVICPGDSALFTFGDDSALSISPGNSVTWLNNTSALVSPDATTNYTVSGFTPCGTYQTKNVSLFVLHKSIAISPDSSIICRGDSVRICAPAGIASYTWSNGDSATCINVQVPGNYFVTVSENGNCTAKSNLSVVNFYLPDQTDISVQGDTLTGSGGISYQWFFDGVAITGATSSVYIANQTGTYTLQAIDSNGCIGIATKQVTVTGIATEPTDNSISVFPNPTKNGWQLTVSNELIGSTAEVYDATGRLIFKATVESEQSTINISNAANGVYQLRITWQGYGFVRKLIKL